jgi:post-segregation antitoxin (ccd killing protein)
MSMASTRTTFTLDSELAEQARRMNVNVSAAARRGVTAAVREALAEADRAAYEQTPEHPDPFWDGAEAWSEQ